MTDKYILNESGDAVAVDDLLAWGQWFEINRERRIVARDEIGAVTVSTVFLGLDHNFDESGPPILWETMIFGGSGELEDYQERYSSRADALDGHRRAVVLVQSTTERHTRTPEGSDDEDGTPTPMIRARAERIAACFDATLVHRDAPQLTTPMSNEQNLTPALTPGNWEGLTMHPFFIRRGKLHMWTGDGVLLLEQLDGIIALANHALPDTDPRKLGWSDVEMLEDLAEDVDGEWGIGDMKDPKVLPILALAAKLAALLPPR